MDPTSPVQAEAVLKEALVPEAPQQPLYRPGDFLHQRYADGHLCCAGCCFSEFLFWPRTCAHTEIDTNVSVPYCCFPCCGGDSTCPLDMAGYDTVPKTCTLLPMLPSPMLYPRLACFPKAGDVYPEMFSDDAARLGVDKSGYFILCSCCVPYVCAGNRYCVYPMESCFVKEGECLCVGSLCSLPVIERHPMAVALYGLVLYPRLACCPRMDEMFPERFLDTEEVESRRLI